MELGYNKQLDSFFADKRFIKSQSLCRNEYPLIWKKEECLPGECANQSITHWWSKPFTTTYGLVVECFHCGKTKLIHIK